MGVNLLRGQLGVVLALLVGTGIASGGVIDFETFPASASSYTQSGVTFSPVGTPSNVITTAVCPNGTKALFGGVGFAYLPIRADIASGATFVSVDLGDYGTSGQGGDAETLYLEVFNSVGQSLGRTEQYQSDFDPVRMYTLSLSYPNISSAVLGSYGGSYGSSVGADNFTFTPTPEPSTIVLFATGAASLLFMAWRRRKRSQ
jgi:hypothetical protein